MDTRSGSIRCSAARVRGRRKKKSADPPLAALFMSIRFTRPDVAEQRLESSGRDLLYVAAASAWALARDFSTMRAEMMEIS